MKARWAALTARHSTVLAVLTVAVSFGAAATALGLWPDVVSAVPESMDPGVRAHPELAPTRLRCDTCGVIEGIRFSEAEGDVPGSYEFSVRLPDGSLRRSSDPRPGRWQVGEQMQLLGGDRTWSAPGASQP